MKIGNVLFTWVSAVTAAVLVLLGSDRALAIHEEPRSPLETAPTHWDATAAWNSEGNAVLDSRDGRIQSVSQLFEGPYAGTPEEAARAFLNAHKDWVGVEPDEKNLRIVRSVESPGGFHVTFERFIGDVRVYPGNLVVSFDRDLYARFYFSSLYVFDEQISTTSVLNAADAERIVSSYLQPQGDPIFGPQTELVIWAGDNRDFTACWKVLVNYEEPRGDWEILVDAASGLIRRVKDLAVAVNGTGYVFDPNPITTSGMPFGSPGLVDNDDANSPQLEAQRFNRTLLDISHFVLFGVDFYSLSGPYCMIDDIQQPNIAPVIQAGSSAFEYTRDADEFEDVCTYYHIDQSQRWMQTLGFNNIQNAPLPCDPHAENFSCNAHYHPSGNYLTFGQGSIYNPDGDDFPDVDAAEDAEVVLHEYGHAINNSITPGWGGGDEGAMGEGWGDYWASSYSRSVSAYEAAWIGDWGLRECFGGRSMQAGLHYPEDAGQEVHYSGEIWSQALYDAEVNINNRTVMNRVSLQSYYYYGTGASMLTAANAVLTADQNLYGGSHQAGITTSFVARGLITPPNNDQCPGFTIYDLPYVTNGSTSTAAHNYDNCAGNLSQDVVYTLVAKPCPREITVSICGGADYDTYLTIRTGGACPGNTQVVCNDDFCGLQSQLTFTTVANQAYYIIVHGYQTQSGTFNISVTGFDSDPLPPNDACVGALVINTLPYAHSSTTCGATNNYNDCIGAASPETVYRLNVPTCQSVTVSLCGSDYDTAVEVRWGGNCPGSQTIACNDDYCGLSSQVTFNATANENYYIFVHGYCTNCEGPYALNVTSNGPVAIPNDDCPGTLITSLPYQDAGNTTCAANDYANCIGTNSNDVVYRYTPLDCEMVTVSLCGSAYDCAVEVRAGGDCPGLVRVNCNDDNCGLQSELTYLAEAGVNYYYIIHGFSNAAGAYVLNVTGTPGGSRPNDFCFGAYAITSLPYVDVGSTSCAGNQTANCVGANSNEVFYSLQLESCSEVTVSLCGSGYDAALEIRSGGFDCPGTIQITCNDDNFCGENFTLQSTAQFTALSNRPYWIIVHGFSTWSGPFIMNVTGTTCSPDSLVIQRQVSNIFLDWAPVPSQGTVSYRVYRALTPDVQAIPGNLIGTTTNAFFTDNNVISNPQDRYFYTVTAEGPALTSELQPDAPVAAVVPEKMIPPQELEAMQSALIPAYLDPAWIESVNPNKPTPEELTQAQQTMWFGTPASLPEHRQVKQ